MKRYSILILFAVVGVVFVSGCISGSQTPLQTQYVCPDGGIVNDPTLCINESSQTTENTEKSWHTVAVFTGKSAGKTSEPYNIRGNQFRYTWLCNTKQKYIDQGKPDVGSINIFVFPIGSAIGVSTINADCIDGQDTSYVYSGAGNYSVDVMVTNVEYWSVTIEDYY